MANKTSMYAGDANDLNPRWNWSRPIAAPGHMAVDFEERVDFRRLHKYRLARVRSALAASGLGALLSFDQHNIRYTTSTVIGEWARDKLLRYSLLTGNGDPYIWDFGSAARHHQLHAPWLQQDHCRAGMTGMRGAVGADPKLFRDAALDLGRDLRDLRGLRSRLRFGHLDCGRRRCGLLRSRPRASETGRPLGYRRPRRRRTR